MLSFARHLDGDLIAIINVVIRNMRFNNLIFAPSEQRSLGSLTERITIASGDDEPSKRRRNTSVNDMSHSPEVSRHNDTKIRITAGSKSILCLYCCGARKSF